MQFLIADTFTDSLARLAGEEQKAVKTTAFDLQMNPENPGMKLHRLDKAKDKNFWSVRISSTLRLIVHKTDKSLLLCYVDQTTPPTVGLNGANLKHIRRPVPLNSWKSGNGWRKL
jgi:mRNA-degrading endonuclease RelE of RelBE toxin-antitoxin system